MVPFTVNTELSTADDPADYTITASPILISAGMILGTITITLVDDLIDDDDEMVVVMLGQPSSGSLGSTTVHTATIVDNDDATPPTVSLSQIGSPLAEAGGTATLSAISGQNVTVNLGFTGTAGVGDYTASGTSILIPAGMLSKSITITGVDDALDEAPETVIVAITGVTNGTASSETGTTQLTISDDDPQPIVRFSVDSQSGSEGAGTLTATCCCRSAAGLDMTVPFAVGGTATDGIDYTITTSPLVIPAGMTSGTITITLVDDASG